MDALSNRFRIVLVLTLVSIASVACSNAVAPSPTAANESRVSSTGPTATTPPVATPTPESDLGPARPLTAETLDGQQVDLASFAGSPVVLFFWREHVTGIEHQLELMQDFYETYSPVGVEFLTVTDREHGLGRKVQTILADSHAMLPTVMLEDAEYMRSYGLELPPGAVLINGDQRVVWKWNGFIDRQRMTTEIANLAGIRPLPSRHSGTVIVPKESREGFFASTPLKDHLSLQSALEPLANQPVVVFVWATGITSTAQRQFLETFLALQEEFANQSVGFIGVAAQFDDRVEQWTVDPDEFDFPVIAADQRELMTELGITGFPTTFYLDRYHLTAGVRSGSLDQRSAENIIGDLISERAVQMETGKR